MAKKLSAQLTNANSRAGMLRSALSGLMRSVARVLEGEEDANYTETEIAAVGLKQAMEEAESALGGDNWDDWGEWEVFSGSAVPLPPEEQPNKILRNNLYEVWVTVRPMLGDTANPPMAEVSIKRRDKLPIDYNHWRIIQRIKDEVLGADADAAMPYPCASRVQDSANQYRIYAMPPGVLMPFGDHGRMVSSKSLHNDGSDDPRKGARQRPYASDAKPSDDLADNPDRLADMEAQVQTMLGGQE